jgi:hypothetical protein
MAFVEEMLREDEGSTRFIYPKKGRSETAKVKHPVEEEK